MVVGQRALAGYLIETSASSEFSLQEALRAWEMNADSLRALATRAKGLLGTRFARLQSSDRKGQASLTPPLRRHRLIELITYCEEAADLLDRRLPYELIDLDGNKITELYSTVGLFDRWRNHPAWPQLVNGLASDSEGQHSLMLLAVASFLCDAGNGVGLVFQRRSGRIPDLWIEPSLVERLNIEVKTPIALRGPRALHLSQTEAEGVITRQVDRAASSRRGQLDTRYSGLLAIGAFHLRSSEVEQLVAAAERVLARQENRKSHLAGVIISVHSFATQTVGIQGIAQSQVSPSLENRLVRHPGYRGDLSIEEGFPPWRTASAF